MKLKDRSCSCDTGEVERLTQKGIETLLGEVQGWTVVDYHHLRKEYTFRTYTEEIDFVNQIATIAEQENHHPDIHMTWRKVAVEIYTHVVNGLSESDFILAAKYDALRT